MPSIVRQIEMALIAIYKPGLPKHNLAREVRERLILAGRPLELYMEYCCTWARWAKQHLGLRRLVDARLMGQPWVQDVIDRGRSAWTVTGYIQGLRKLEYGIRARWGSEVTLIVPKALAGRAAPPGGGQAALYAGGTAGDPTAPGPGLPGGGGIHAGPGPAPSRGYRRPGPRRRPVGLRLRR